MNLAQLKPGEKGTITSLEGQVLKYQFFSLLITLLIVV